MHFRANKVRLASNNCWPQSFKSKIDIAQGAVNHNSFFNGASPLVE